MKKSLSFLAGVSQKITSPLKFNSFFQRPLLFGRRFKPRVTSNFQIISYISAGREHPLCSRGPFCLYDLMGLRGFSFLLTPGYYVHLRVSVPSAFLTVQGHRDSDTSHLAIQDFPVGRYSDRTQ